jgi:hypothetical protein
MVPNDVISNVVAWMLKPLTFFKKICKFYSVEVLDIDQGGKKFS